MTSYRDLRIDGASGATPGYAIWEDGSDVYPPCGLCRQPGHPVEHAKSHYLRRRWTPADRSRAEAAYVAILQRRARARKVRVALAKHRAKADG